MVGRFTEEYKKLNKAQKRAVDKIDGPVIVVAGPGTGKTQILSLRIANILNKTDAGVGGILALTFTNSAVDAMKARLVEYIGESGNDVNISTFHSFGLKLIEEHYKVLGLKEVPKLLEDTDAVLLFDQILQQNEWEHLRPRADSSRYFKDLKSLWSILRRERITLKYFLSEVEKEIENFSGSKLKKDAARTESLERSREVAKFFNLYEEEKKKKNILDYDDVLEGMVAIVERSSDALASIRERYLYVLVDEHQDSSRIQNEFLKLVWGGLEDADIFVVGDDRQLIYGFSGASIDHFQGFKKTWPDAELITLIDNYRSTQVILDASHALLRSVMTDEKLVSQSKEHHPIRLVEAEYPVEEIRAAAADIKDKVKSGVNIEECVILVPKNRDVRRAFQILHSEGLKISAGDGLSLFEQEGAQALLRVMRIITDPNDVSSFALSFFDKYSGIDPVEASKYIFSQNMREFSIGKAIDSNPPSLFGDGSRVEAWISKLSKWKKYEDKDVVLALKEIGEELFKEEKNGELVSGQDILNTFIALAEKEKNKPLTLKEFVSILNKLEAYGEDIPVNAKDGEGVKVLTLHSSKGQEFDYVWIAHMNERSLNSAKRMGFTLPESIEEKIFEHDKESVKRQLYVAITRAKRFCTLSYARLSNSDAGQELAEIIEELPEEVFKKVKISDSRNRSSSKKKELKEIIKLVGDEYTRRLVSASMLNNFFECAWKWYFNNFLGLPPERSESLIFGDKVHEGIDQILKENKLVLPEDKEAAKVLRAWASRRLKEIAGDRENEYSVSLKDKKFPNFNIYGRIDLIEKLSDKTLRVTDFKTGSVRKNSDINKRDEEGRLSNLARQLAMYSYLLENTPKWKGVKVSESRLEFIEAKNIKDSILDHQVTEEEINLLVKDIEDYEKLVKEGGWTERECHYNSYGKGTECEFCKLSEIYES